MGRKVGRHLKKKNNYQNSRKETVASFKLNTGYDCLAAQCTPSQNTIFLREEYILYDQQFSKMVHFLFILQKHWRARSETG